MPRFEGEMDSFDIYIYIVIAYFSSRFSLFGVYPQLINQDLLMGG